MIRVGSNYRYRNLKVIKLYIFFNLCKDIWKFEWKYGKYNLLKVIREEIENFNIGYYKRNERMWLKRIIFL